MIIGGWSKVSQKGSHLKLRKYGYKDIIVPIHNRDLPKGLLISILKHSNLNN